MSKYLTMSTEDCEKSSNLFEEVVDMLSTVKETQDEDLRDAFDLHVKVTIEKFQARAPLLTDVDVRRADYILALQGVHDFVNQYVIHYAEHSDPRLSKLLRELRQGGLDFAREQQAVAEDLASRLHAAEDKLEATQSKYEDALHQGGLEP